MFLQTPTKPLSSAPNQAQSVLDGYFGEDFVLISSAVL
jgi:hypothetical protein